MLSFIFDLQLTFQYDIPTYSVKKSDTTDRYGQIITVGGVGGDFSHTQIYCGRKYRQTKQ